MTCRQSVHGWRGRWSTCGGPWSWNWVSSSTSTNRIHHRRQKCVVPSSSCRPYYRWLATSIHTFSFNYHMTYQTALIQYTMVISSGIFRIKFWLVIPHLLHFFLSISLSILSFSPFRWLRMLIPEKNIFFSSCPCADYRAFSYTARWLGSVAVGRWTRDQEFVGSTPTAALFGQQPWASCSHLMCLCSPSSIIWYIARALC